MKQTFTGIIFMKHLNIGTGSEHYGPVLDTGTEQYKLRLQGDNPFENNGLKPFVGKHVDITGTYHPQYRFLAIENVTDIVERPLTPLKKPKGPTPPKP